MDILKNYYFVLGIPKTATQADIENAYRYSVNAINATDLGAFADNGQYQASLLRDINEAYQCLKNPILRRKYDLSLDAATPAPLTAERINPAWRQASSRESIEMCFATMKKKRSKSFPTTGRFLISMIFFSSLGYSIFWGLNYFNTGDLSLAKPKLVSLEASFRQKTPQASAAQAPPPAMEAPPAQTPQSGRQGYIKEYDIRFGGVISEANTACRKNPSQDSPILARLPNNETVFVTKETKDGDGTTWYFVDGRNGKGWVPLQSVKVFK